jgi:RNA polymerase sigma-70 factor (ECF subfamily)
VTHDVDLVEEFEAARPRLLSLAHRIVGSVHDAEDVVQTAWLRAQTAGDAALDNPQGWFTTVTARLCLDQLRARHRRGELPLLAEHISGERLAVDEEYLRREEISRALLVLLEQLSPSQRVAYVLHDLFAVPFEQVAAVLDVSPASAKKLASRARIRLRAAEPAQDAPAEARARRRAADPAEGAGMRRRAAEPAQDAPAGARARRGAADPAEAGIGQHAAIVDAFLAAARGGDLNRLIALMAPDVVRTADARLLPDTAPAVVRGAASVAEETRYFLDRIAATVPMVVDGRPGAVIAPGGHPYALLSFRIRDGVIAAIEITPYEPGAHLAPLPVPGS